MNLTVKEKNGYSTLVITVVVEWKPKAKLFSSVLPVITIAVFDVAFHFTADYTNTEGVFTAQALMAGIGMQLMDPEFLGFPAAIKETPFIQMFSLMIIVGALKTAALYLLRVAWTRKTTALDDAIAEEYKTLKRRRLYCDATAAALRSPSKMKDSQDNVDEQKATMKQLKEIHHLEQDAAALDRLQTQLEKYETGVRISVPVWYLVSWLCISSSWGLLSWGVTVPVVASSLVAICAGYAVYVFDLFCFAEDDDDTSPRPCSPTEPAHQAHDANANDGAMAGISDGDDRNGSPQAGMEEHSRHYSPTNTPAAGGFASPDGLAPRGVSLPE